MIHHPTSDLTFGLSSVRLSEFRLQLHKSESRAALAGVQVHLVDTPYKLNSGQTEPLNPPKRTLRRTLLLAGEDTPRLVIQVASVKYTGLGRKQTLAPVGEAIGRKYRTVLGRWETYMRRGGSRRSTNRTGQAVGEVGLGNLTAGTRTDSRAR